MKKLTIITVCLNSEKYIEECILSVITQDYPFIEYIIWDGGSTDKTPEIINKYKDDITLFTIQKDKGVYDAMNKAVKLATGDFVMYLNSDDYLLEENSISQLMGKADEAIWLTAFEIIVNENKKIISKDKLCKNTIERQFVSNIIRHPATAVSRTCFHKFSFDYDFKYAADYLFFLEVWSFFGDPQIVLSHISAFRLTGDNLSSNFKSSLKDEYRAKRWFRKKHKQKKYLLFDFLIYILRYIKLLLRNNCE